MTEQSDAERIHELKWMLASHLGLTTNAEADPGRLEWDLWIEGPLSEIVQWAYDWRSEIEELG